MFLHTSRSRISKKNVWKTRWSLDGVWLSMAHTCDVMIGKTWSRRLCLMYSEGTLFTSEILAWPFPPRRWANLLVLPSLCVASTSCFNLSPSSCHWRCSLQVASGGICRKTLVLDAAMGSCLHAACICGRAPAVMQREQGPSHVLCMLRVMRSLVTLRSFGSKWEQASWRQRGKMTGLSINTYTAASESVS